MTVAKPRRGRARFTGLCAALVLLSNAAGGLATASASEVRALIVGIDQYPHLGERAQLEGAVNDATDIAGALGAVGATDVVVLVNREATKSAIKQAWEALIARAAAGDTVVFSYAGHGSEEPANPASGDASAGKRQNFILGGFGPKAPENAERILNDEVKQWLNDADAKGLRVIFIADSCFSGGMYRSALAKGVRFRNVTIPEITDDQLVLPPPVFAKMSPADFRKVTFVSATDANRVIPEIKIDGRWRGALSYSFARAIEGAADRDKDGRITQAELVSFVVPKVHELVEGQQTPQVLPVRASGEILIAAATAEPKKAPKTDADTLNVAVIGGSSNALANMPGIAVVADIAQSDVFWDIKAGVVEHLIGGRVAEGVDERSIIPVIGKWATLKWLQANAKGAPGQFMLHSGNQRYKPGTEISLSFNGAELPYLTLFNLAPDGRVEFFVEPYEVNIDWRGRRADWKFRPDKPPFGSEHMIAVLTEEPLVEFHTALKAMSTADRAVGLRDIVEATLGSRRFQLGVIGIYTGEGG